MIETSVLIAGGGPVGMTLAMDLAWRGIGPGCRNGNAASDLVGRDIRQPGRARNGISDRDARTGTNTRTGAGTGTSAGTGTRIRNPGARDIGDPASGSRAAIATRGTDQLYQPALFQRLGERRQAAAGRTPLAAASGRRHHG